MSWMTGFFKGSVDLFFAGVAAIVPRARLNLLAPFTQADNPAIGATDVGIADATGSVAGLMPFADKNKLDNIIPYAVTATKTANYTAAYGEVVGVDATAGTFTVTLPSAAESNGQSITVVSRTANMTAVLIDAVGSETINGAANYSLPGGRAHVVLMSDGTNWIAFPPA